MSAAWILVIAILLVAANGFFVAMEFAILAARRGRVEQAAQEGRMGAASALAGMSKLNVQLATCQLGITVMSLLLGFLVEPVVGGAIEGRLGETRLPHAFSAFLGVSIALLIVSFVHMVLGEMVPKSVALSSPEQTLFALAPIHRVITKILKPVVAVLNGLGNWGTKLLGVEPRDELAEAHTAPELAAMLAESAAVGELDQGELDLLSGALGFLRVTVADVMAERADLVTVPASATLGQAEDLIHRSGHSRVLVTTPDGREVIGFLHAKDLLQYGDRPAADPLPEGLVRVAQNVAPDDPLAEVLPKMRHARRHVAVVVDNGEVQGLVTLEDLLEAIVGEIRDETDRLDS